MDNIFELLVLFFFIVLPLLQQLFGRRGEEDEGAAGQIDAEEPGAPSRPRDPEPEWSADWGEWPDEEAGVEIEGATVSTPPAEELRPRERLRLEEEVPEAVRVSSPVVSLEPLYVDRSRQRAAPRAAPALRPRPRGRAPRLAKLISGPSDLRRAVLLSEILAPPRGLRDFGGDSPVP